MKRRTLLAAATAALARPAIGRAQANTTLRFIPQADLSILDPHFNTAYVTRNHGFMVYDTLYGLNGTLPSPSGQMVAGHTDRRRRQALDAHPARRPCVGMTVTPVLARDCVASIKPLGRKGRHSARPFSPSTDTLDRSR